MAQQIAQRTYQCHICGKIFVDRTNFWKHLNKKKTACISQVECLKLVDKVKMYEIENENYQKQCKNLKTELQYLKQDQAKQERRAFNFFKYLTKSDPELLVSFSDIFRSSEVNYKTLQEFANKLNRKKRYVPEKIKKNVAYSQDHKCNGCDKLLPPSHEIDHVIPLYLGGLNVESNLQALCAECHNEKTVEDFSNFYFDISALKDHIEN